MGRTANCEPCYTSVFFNGGLVWSWSSRPCDYLVNLKFLILWSGMLRTQS